MSSGLILHMSFSLLILDMQTDGIKRPVNTRRHQQNRVIKYFFVMRLKKKKKKKKKKLQTNSGERQEEVQLEI